MTDFRHLSELPAQAFVDIAGVMLIALDRSARVTAVNPRTCEVLGRDEGSIVGRDWFGTFVPEHVRDAVRQGFESLIRGGLDVYERFENPVLSADGSERTIEFHNALLRDAEGRVVGTLSSGLDVTEQRRAHELLAASEAKYRRIVEASNDGIWVIDPEGRTTFVNRRLAEMMGGSESDMIGRSAFEFMDDGWRVVAEHNLERRRRGIQEVLEFCFRRLDGSPLWALVSTAPTFDEDGHPTGALAMVTDISERKAAERALVERARQHAVVAELGQRALRGGGLEDFYDAVVQELAETLGVSHCKILELQPDAGVLRLRAGVGWKPGLVGVATVGTGRESQAGYTLRASGPVIVSDVSAEARFRPPPLLDEHGLVSGMSVIIGDPDEPWGVLGAHHTEPHSFTEDDAAFLQSAANLVALVARRQRLERERADIASRYRALVDQSTDAVVLVDLEGRIEMFNAAAEEVSGYTASEVLGVSILEAGFFVPASRAAFLGELDRLGRGEPGAPLDMEIAHRDGSTRIVQSRHRVIRREGAIVGVLAVLRDVTQERALERQLQQAQRMESIGRLAGGVAHDFNNLLSVILCVANLARENDAVPDETVADLAEIDATATRARSLTQQLLAFARRQVVEPVVVDVNRQVRSIETMLVRILGEDVSLETFLDPEAWMVEIDPARLEQMLVNLVVNARDAMPHGGRLTIETANAALEAEDAAGYPDRAPGDHVMLTVSDTGTGIDPSIRDRIFEPFSTTKPRDAGTGLGLSTCYGIVTQAGGFIDVDSEWGRGSRFRVWLPRAEAPPRCAAPPRAASATGTGETILVVEDERAVRRVVLRCLEGLGYVVLEAEDGQAALEVLERLHRPVHAVVTDVVMPRMGGIEFARRLSERWPGTKIVFTSGYTDDAEEIPTSDPGVAFLPKPYTPDDLQRVLRGVLE